LNNGTIPAEITVGNSTASALILNPQFLVSMNQIASNGGLQITISALGNVSGPRLLLFNVSSGSIYFPSSGRTLAVVFDGQQISEAASLQQVLNTNSTGTATYVLIGTSTGVQILVAIPHFSSHVIEIIPEQLVLTGSSPSQTTQIISTSTPTLTSSITTASSTVSSSNSAELAAIFLGGVVVVVVLVAIVIAISRRHRA
jgi:hypothetical protein